MKTQTQGIHATEAMRQTERVLTSRVFAKAKRSQRLLRYLVDAALTDPTQAVKEYTIATEIFDRDASYDPAIDATVRVEAGRLRSRLREYYNDEGRLDAFLIELPKGAYRVVLSERGELQEQKPEPYKSNTAHHVGYADSGSVAFMAREELANPNTEQPRTLAASSIDAERREQIAQLVKKRPAWHYVLSMLAFGLLLGYAGWRLARVQSPPSHVRSVAVLPLKNLSGDPAQDYFADGTTDELITQLARVPGLRVVSWNSVVQEKDTKKPLKAIAQELRADLLVEGSIARSGDLVRINAQLIDTRDDGHLWADSFEGPLSDVMALENKAAEEIVRHASANGGARPADASLQARFPVNPAAHDAYLRGKNYFDKRQARESAEQFQRAIDLSPAYASAYSGVAMALSNEAFLGVMRPEQAIPQAAAAVDKALQLDPDNGDALIARGSIETAFLWKWDAAERDLTRGIALSPNDSYGRMMLSVYLDSMGRTDDAVKQMQQAVEMDPLSFFMARHYGSALFYARRYDEALRQLQYARQMYPASAVVVDHWISEVYAKKGMYDDAVRYDLLGLQDDHSSHNSHKLLAAYRQNGWQGYWAARQQELHGDSTDPLFNYDVATAAMRAGRHNEAIAALKRAADEHCYWIGVALIDPALDDLRGEKGFADVLAELHLPANVKP